MADETQWKEAFKDSGKQPVIRIRLPNDYAVNQTADLVGDPERRLTLEDFTRIQSRFAASAAYESIMRPNALADMLFMGYKPPTPWQKRKMRLKDFFSRFKTAYRVIRGDDLHEDCY